MRVGIVGIQHESNTFLPIPTTLQQFKDDALLTGEAIRDSYADSHHEVGGFFAALGQADIEAAPLLLALATPAGPLTAETFECLIKMMLNQLHDAGPLDGLLVAPHGAAVSEHCRDMDGHWLSILRQRVGVETPIVCTLDPHANVSERMIAACNATISYSTNPHVDQHHTGLKAGRLLTQTLRGEIHPVQALAQSPIAISIDRQETSAPPCTGLYELSNAILNRPAVLSNSVCLGFPYADVQEIGSSFVVVTDDKLDLANDYGAELARYLEEHRNDFACHLTDVTEAARQAAQDEGPVCLLDMGDNVGGGSPGDGTTLAHALHQENIGPSFICLFDPEAARQARDAGIGQSLHLAMGGKADTRHGPPLITEVQVISLHDGRFTEPQVRHGGRTGYDMGQTAIVRTSNDLTIMLISKRIPPFSLQQLIHCGLDPQAFQVIIAKGVVAPIAAYRPVCQRFIQVNTPGVTCADMTQLPFQHRRRPLFPFES